MFIIFVDLIMNQFLISQQPLHIWPFFIAIFIFSISFNVEIHVVILVSLYIFQYQQANLHVLSSFCFLVPPFMKQLSFPPPCSPLYFCSLYLDIWLIHSKDYLTFQTENCIEGVSNLPARTPKCGHQLINWNLLQCCLPNVFHLSSNNIASSFTRLISIWVSLL